MYHRIVVPLDGSSTSEQALPFALTLARASGAALELVRVHHSVWAQTLAGLANPVGLFDRFESDARESAVRYLTHLVTRVETATGVRPTWSVVEGQPAAAIDEAARRSRADLLVMTTHGHGGLTRSWLGSVSDALMRRVEVPMLVVRPEKGEAKLGAAASLERILVPLDGSELAEAAVKEAVALGRPVGSRYTLLCVVVPLPLLGYVPAAESAPEAVPDAVEGAQRYLDGVADGLRAEGLAVDAEVVVHSAPAGAILEFAQEHRCDAIALSTHGRGGVSRLLLGSVADKLIRGARIPVLVRRPARG